MTVTGIRPDFIRMSEIFRKLDSADWCYHTLIHTGQHYDDLLSGVFFDDLTIREPDFNLKIGAAGRKHYDQHAGAKIIRLIEDKLVKKPDIILFLGDSNSVLASVPLRKEGYRIGHIEAGMRSYDERMLEEINRKICDHVSNILFVYHENYKLKAIKEGISSEKIHVVGNTIVEPLLKIADLTHVNNKNHILIDIHRPENFQNKYRMKTILEFVNECGIKAHKPTLMLKFGRTMKAIKEFKLDTGNIKFVDLMSYKVFVKIMQDSLFMISDSGTAQEEPALLGVPVIVPRDYTERPESYLANNSYMLKLHENCFDDTFRWALKDEPRQIDWLGDGSTSTKILQILRENT